MSSRPLSASAEITTIGVFWYCGSLRRSWIRLMPSRSGSLQIDQDRVVVLGLRLCERFARGQGRVRR